ncbi:glycosyltransferase family 32 protein [Fusicatenibacter saccharivorans]|uniref:glycosyltransferase family 32 protein n=1 Tax=Fusicatenibacter saccharivorans TaxID=1150298 RepID=UPI003F901306
MIPKTIHYCWFGRGSKSELILKCINSWKTYCPDYEIVEWNEDNFNVNFCTYSSDAYNNKKWAFVSDIARLKILYDNGGIYLDTDVEIHNNFDDLLHYDAWFAQDDIRYINTGLGFGACKGNELIQTILSKRAERKFDMTICNAIDTPIIREYLGCKQSRESQRLGNTYIIGMVEYPKYAKHWEGNSWKEEDDRQFQNTRRNRFWKIKCLMRNPELINCLERNGETKISKIYVFLAYDFLDNGPMYFIKRIFKKIIKNP